MSILEYKLKVLSVEIHTKFDAHNGYAWSGHILPTFTIKIGNAFGSLPTSRSNFDEPVTIHGEVIDDNGIDAVLFRVDPESTKVGGVGVIQYGNFDWTGIGSHKYDFAPTKIADDLLELPPIVCEQLLEQAILGKAVTIDHHRYREANWPS
jgi:hypothetical protein